MKNNFQKYILLLAAFAFPGLHTAYGQFIDISLPLNRSVYQRDLASKAVVPVAVQFKNGLTRKFSYKVEKLNVITGGAPMPETIEILNVPENGLFQANLQVNAGWHKLTIQTYDADNSLLETGEIKFGVGEVVFSAGQSNMQGIGLGAEGSPLLQGNAYDGLSLINQNCFCKKTFPFPVFEKMERGTYDTQKKIAPNGNQNLWCYEVAARKISDENGGIPVIFFNTASTGTSVMNWSESADNRNAVTSSPWTINCNTDVAEWGSEGAEGHPYLTLKTALNFYGGMFGARAVVWHQGESDKVIGTSKDTYRAGLVNVINRSRQHFNSGLAWTISRVSYFPPGASGAVIQGQEEAKNSLSNTSWGAYYSDDFTGVDVFRQSDDLHFNQEGLVSLGNQIATGSYTPFGSPSGFTPLTALAPVTALAVPNVNVTESGGAYTLTVDGNYQSYCWVNQNGPINNCQFTTPSIEVSSGKWRCYVTHTDNTPVQGHEQQNISLTRNIELPLTRFQNSLGIGSPMQIVK